MNQENWNRNGVAWKHFTKDGFRLDNSYTQMGFDKVKKIKIPLVEEKFKDFTLKPKVQFPKL